MRRNHLLNPKTGAGAIIVASAMAAAAWNEIEHRSVRRAEISDKHVRIDRLSDLRRNRDVIEVMERELQREWGPFAFLGLPDCETMIDLAGRSVFVASQLDGDVWVAKGCVQTTFIKSKGDAASLLAAYPTFRDLTDRAAWRKSRRGGVDTIVLLQITVFRGQDRGGGFGSLLRNALLNLLPSEIKYAFTTTPIDSEAGAAGLDLTLPASYTPAMKFHARGGAQPALVLPGYKQPPPDTASTHGSEIVVMRYERDETGAWPAARPAMRVHSRGPLEQQVVSAARRLRSLRPGSQIRRLRGLPRRLRVSPRWANRLVRRRSS